MLLKTGEDDQQSSISLQAGSNNLYLQQSARPDPRHSLSFLTSPSSSDNGNGLILYAPGNTSGTSGSSFSRPVRTGSGSEKMRLDATETGIGTETPAAKFDVNATSPSRAHQSSTPMVIGLAIRTGLLVHREQKATRGQRARPAHKATQGLPGQLAQ